MPYWTWLIYIYFFLFPLGTDGVSAWYFTVLWTFLYVCVQVFNLWCFNFCLQIIWFLGAKTVWTSLPVLCVLSVIMLIYAYDYILTMKLNLEVGVWLVILLSVVYSYMNVWNNWFRRCNIFQFNLIMSKFGPFVSLPGLVLLFITLYVALSRPYLSVDCSHLLINLFS